MAIVFFSEGDQDPVRRTILCGLERARTRMAVAMARENKSTTAAVRARYQRIESGLRSILKPLRCRWPAGQSSPEDWERVMQILATLPAPPDAGSPGSEIQRLCDHLFEVLEILDFSDHGGAGRKVEEFSGSHVLPDKSA